MLGLVRPYKARLAAFLLAGFAFGGLNALFPLVGKTILNLLAERAVPAWLAPYAAGWSLEAVYVGVLLVGGSVLLLKCAAQYARAYLQAWLTQTVVLGTQNRLADHLLTLDLTHYHRERAGDLLSRLTNDLGLLRASVKLTCVLLTRPVTVALVLASVFALNWRLALLGLVGAPAAGLLISRLYRKMRRAAKKAQEKRADLTSVMVQFLNGIRTVKAFACEAFESRQFREENRRLFQVLMKHFRARARVRPIIEFLSGAGALAVMYVGGRWVLEGRMQIGDFGGFLAALGILYAPAKELGTAWSEVQETLPGAQRVFQVLDLESKVKDGTEPVAGLAEEIRFDRVGFSYEGGTEALRDVTLRIGKGERVALVGPSGAGKSTLADLILRFYDPTEGRVLLDGTDLRALRQGDLRRLIAYVGQETFLFNCSVRENIAYGREDVSPEAIREAARVARIDAEIAAMPAGYDTVVGERGENLSGGQRQRIAIARAVLKDAPILVLDEATSALDSHNERLVQEALDRLMEGRTTLVIAHRLSTIRHADRIFVLEAGRLTAAGSHAELLDASPTYARLVALQNAS